MTTTGRVCCVAAALFSVASAACNAQIEKSLDTTQVNALLKPASAELNEAWPSMAVEKGLDPLTAETNYNKNLGGSAKAACKAYCGAKKSSCHAFKFHVDEVVLYGMQGMKIGDLQVSDWELSGGQGAQCDLQVNASAPVAADLNIELKGANLKFQCKNMWGKKRSTTIWKGKGSCKGSHLGPNAVMNLTLEGSIENPLEKPDMESTDASSFDPDLVKKNCQLDNSGGIPGLSDIISAFSSDLLGSIIKVLTPSMSNAITGINIGDIMFEAGMLEQHSVSAASVTVV